MREHIHFVTGRLAEYSLRDILTGLAPRAGFDYSIEVLGITVAALMTTDWIAPRLHVPAQTTRVLLPGYCQGDLQVVEQVARVPVERGPRDLRRLGEFFGESAVAADYGAYDIQILAEINSARRLSLEELILEADRLRADGADMIDLGCDPGEAWPDIGAAVAALVAAGHRVSIDSMNVPEVEAAVRAGAELVLSVNSSNRQAAVDWNCRVVVVPDDPATLAGLDETIEFLAERNVPLVIDPILEPIGFGFAASLGRFLDVRRRYPDAEMMMGIGNLTELTDADSAPINVLLLGFCQELGIRNVLTTEVINWARSSVRECDLARRLVHYSDCHHTLPKRLEPRLVMLRDPTVMRHGPEALDRLAGEIKDHNYRLFAEDGKLHAVTAGLHATDTDPFALFAQCQRHAARAIDPAHAFYLGYELAKAVTALTLGKDYRQDEALDWGFLTRGENHHRLERAKASPERPAEPLPESPVVAGLRFSLRVAVFDTDSLIETDEGAIAAPWQGATGAAPLDTEALFARVAGLPHCLFLDSARREPTLGRYSFLAVDPFDYFELAADGSDGLAELGRRMAPWQVRTIAGLPPFQGGAAGLFGYDLGSVAGKRSSARFDEFHTPAWRLGYTTSCWRSITCWIGPGLFRRDFRKSSLAPRRRRAAERLAQMRGWLDGTLPVSPCWPVRAPLVPKEQLAPQFAVPGPAGLTSNFSAGDYLATVRRAIEYIHAGDVFQVNIAQRLLYPAHDDAVSLYLRLRRCNPATFAGYFDLGATQIVSASPERFVKVQDGLVETRPIKGTRQRTARPEADLFAGDEMMQNEKDRAENVMIVDLLRNDLSRVCRPDSVRVTQLCRLERYEFVQHLVSAVCGELAAGRTALDLLRASFPGGSITGAPKVRAMQIIAELEPTARGAYCGALGYLGFDGALDTSILIRTITAAGGWWQSPVGGGIVAQSVSEREYEETWHKATGLLRALEASGPT